MVAFLLQSKPVKHIRINHLKVKAFLIKKWKASACSIFENLLETDEGISLESQDAQQMMQDIYTAMDADLTNPLDAAYKALHVDKVAHDPFAEDFFAEPTETFREELNIFMPMRRSEHVKDTAFIQDMEKFGKSLLNRSDTREYWSTVSAY